MPPLVQSASANDIQLDLRGSRSADKFLPSNSPSRLGTKVIIAGQQHWKRPMVFVLFLSASFRSKFFGYSFPLWRSRKRKYSLILKFSPVREFGWLEKRHQRYFTSVHPKEVKVHPSASHSTLYLYHAAENAAMSPTVGNASLTVVELLWTTSPPQGTVCLCLVL